MPPKATRLPSGALQIPATPDRFSPEVNAARVALFTKVRRFKGSFLSPNFSRTAAQSQPPRRARVHRGKLSQCNAARLQGTLSSVFAYNLSGYARGVEYETHRPHRSGVRDFRDPDVGSNAHAGV